MTVDLTPSDEQQQLKDSLERFLADHYGFDQRAAFAGRPEGFSLEIWRQFAELGLLALPFSLDDGGLGLGPEETMVVMQALGGALALEPYLATVVLSGGLLRRCGQSGLARSLAKSVGEGDVRLAFAHTERRSRYDLTHVEALATRTDGGYRLSGDKRLVLNGDTADHLIVSARLNDTGDMALFVAPADAPGLQRVGYRTFDGMRAADVTLTQVYLAADARLSPPGDALPIVEGAIDEAIAAVCAEAVGAMDALLALTVDYLKVRRQFGAALGAFQGLQHRAADMYVMVEQARSMALYAAIKAGAEDPEERRKAVAAAKIQIGRSARFVGQQAVQLHGAIGLTWDYKAGHLFKRLTMIERLFGDADHHLGRLAGRADTGLI